MDANSLFENDISDEYFLNKNISIELDDIKSEFESYGFLFSTRKQTDLLSKINNSNFAELILAKHRNGPTGTVKLLFDSQFTQFKNLVRGMN